MRRTLVRALGGIAMGAAAWFSLGVLGIAGDHSPVGLLPPWWLLVVLLSFGAAAAVALSRVSTALLVLPALTLLPWACLPWPPAQIWSGPLVLVLWALLGVGVALAYWPSRVRFADAFSTVAIAAAAVMTAFTLGAGRSSITGDAPHYLLMSQSLIADGDLDLANDYDPSRHRDFYAGRLEPHHTVVTPSGREYSFHGLGVAVLVVPGFLAGGLTGARALLLLISVLGVGAVWRAIRDLTGQPGAAWAGAAALVLQLPFLAQSAAVFPDGPAAAVTALTLLTLVRLEKHPTVSLASLAATGVALAFLPWLHLRLAFLSAVFGAALVAALFRRRASSTAFVALLAAPVIGAAVMFASSYVMFGTLNPTAAFRQTDSSGSLSATPIGAFGLLADVEYGLLPYAPAMIFGVAGARQLVKRLALTGWASVIAVFGTLLISASFGWWAGTSSPARYVVPVLPVVALWFGCWWSTAGVRLRMVAAAVMVMSLVIASLAAWADGGMYVVTVPDGRLTIFEWANRVVSVPDALPSLFRAGRVVGTEASIAAAWALSGVVVLWAGARGMKGFHVDMWSMTAWMTAAWISVAAGVAWAVRGAPAHTPDRSQLALLHASGRTWLPVAWAAGRPVESVDEVLRSLAFESPGEPDSRIALHVPYPPAGQYQLEVTHSADASRGGLLTLEAGRDATPMWSWPANAPEQAPSLTTVMRLHSLRVIRPDAQGARVRLRSLGRHSVTHELSDLVAEQALRFGNVLVYLVDAAQAVETGGFWLAGDRRTRVVLAALDGTFPGVTLQFEAATTPVEVRLARGGWRQTIAIPPRDRVTVDVPGTTVAELMEIEVMGGERQRPDVFVSALPKC